MEQHDDEQQGLAAVPTAIITLLPDDVLADVFRRVASPRGLAACRCVCRAWRALIDDRRLLRADLLPLLLAGLLLFENELWSCPSDAELFVRPGADDITTGYLISRYPISSTMVDHCNGLILIHGDEVVNPATGRAVCLPECPQSPLWDSKFLEDQYLAFDPAESPDRYQVLSVPKVISLPGRDHKAKPAYRAISWSEWPPSPFVLSVFSSVTGQWEARSLVRQGGAAGTVVDDIDSSLYDCQHSACWRGALYVHWQNDLVLRIPLADHTRTYQVIRPPRELEEEGRRGGGCLGRSEKGVYFASFDRKRHLCVWILQDSSSSSSSSSSCGHMEWILKHRSPYKLALPPSSPPRSPWTLLHNAIRSEDRNADAQEWDSDDDNDDDDETATLHTETGDKIHMWFAGYEILALHPYREIVFMESRNPNRVVAYHLKSSKLEDLGDPYPRGRLTKIENAFPYTPCWMEAP